MRKGTDAEGKVAGYLRSSFPLAERRAKQGSKDRGDIGGIAAGVVIEVKAEAPPYGIPGWLREADVEATNDDAEIAAVFAKLRGKAEPEDWMVVMRPYYFKRLLECWVQRPFANNGK